MAAIPTASATTLDPPDRYRLLDIVHADNKLYLVFEFIDIDLKRYIEHGNHTGKPISLAITKVSWLEPSSCPLRPFSVHGQTLRVLDQFPSSLSRQRVFYTRTTLCSFSSHVPPFTTHTLSCRNSQSNLPPVSYIVIPTESYTETSNLRTFSSTKMTTSSWPISDSHGRLAFPCERILTKYVGALGTTTQLTCLNVVGRNALVPGTRSAPWLSALWDGNRHVVCWMHLRGDGQQGRSALSRGFGDRPNLQDFQVSTSHPASPTVITSLTPIQNHGDTE